MQLLTAMARAYVYSGEWVADCPRGCGNVEYLYDLANPQDLTGPRTRQKPQFYCSYCRLITGIEWPHDMESIMEVLGLRPIPHTRNWYPEGHDTALQFRIPHGQSVDDLRAENVENGVPATAVGRVM